MSQAARNGRSFRVWVFLYRARKCRTRDAGCGEQSQGQAPAEPSRCNRSVEILSKAPGRILQGSGGARRYAETDRGAERSSGFRERYRPARILPRPSETTIEMEFSLKVDPDSATPAREKSE